MDKLLDIIATWDHFGQGLFFLIITSGILSFLSLMAYYVVVLFRGWAPPGVKGNLETIREFLD